MLSIAALTRSNSPASRVGSATMIVSASISLVGVGIAALVLGQKLAVLSGGSQTISTDNTCPNTAAITRPLPAIGYYTELGPSTPLLPERRSAVTSRMAPAPTLCCQRRVRSSPKLSLRWLAA